jgi:hypothetical protein
MTTLSFVSIKIICLVVSLFVVCVPREGDALLNDGITFEGEVLLDIGVTFKGRVLLDVGVIFEGGVLLEGPGFLDEGVTLEGVYFEIGTLFEEPGFCILESIPVFKGTILDFENGAKRIGVDIIHKRVMCLTGWLLDNMQAMKYPNGQIFVKIHGPSDLEKRGGTIAFNLYHADGTPFDCQVVQDAANKAKISLRTGCFCNPGDGEVSHNITRNEMASCFENLKPSSMYPYGSDCKNHESCLAVKTKMASIRVSLGLVTNFSDVYLFMNFLHGLLCEPEIQVSKAEKVKRRVFLNKGP